MKTNPWHSRWQPPSRPSHTPARKVVRPTGGIVRGKFASRKNRQTVEFEQLLELDLMYLLEAAPSVAAYVHQPIRLRYPDGARLRTYTPDLHLSLTSGVTIYVEVKPDTSMADPEIAHKLEAVAKQFERNNERFEVLTSSDIRREPRLSNVKWLYQQAAPALPTSEAAAWHAQGLFSDHGHTIRSAQAHLARHGVDPFSLLLMGACTCDVDQPVSLETPIHLSAEQSHGRFLVSSRLGF